MPRINMSEIWALWLSTTMDYSSLNWTGASNDWPSRAWYKLIYIFFISSSTVPTIIFLRLSLKSLKFWPVEFVLQIEFWVSYGVMRPWCLKRSLPSDLDKVDVNFCHEAKFCGTFTASAAALSSYFASHTVQDSQKSEEKCPGVLWYIFEIHYMVPLKRHIKVNHRGTRSRDRYPHNLGQ